MSEGDANRYLTWPDRAEWRWAAVVAAVIMIATCLPYLFGWLIRPPDHYYSGLLTNPDEHNVYLAQMRQARDGHLLFLDPFTSEPQQGRIVNVFFLSLGVFARVTHLALPVVYHLARVISGWLLLMAVYWLAAQVLPIAGRRVAVLLVATASGFGWLFHAQGGQPHPIDYGPGLVMPEAITFLSLLLNPLFSFSIFLMVATLGLAVHAFTSGSARSAALAGVAGLVLGNIHTYDLIPVGAVLALYLIYLLASRQAGTRAVALALLIAALAAPSVAYQYWLLSAGEPGVVAKTLGQWDYSRGPRYLVLGLGLPLILALAGAARAARQGGGIGRLLAIWLVAGFALVYLPVPFQRKLAEGLHIPICVLAVLALAPLWRQAGRQAVVAAAMLVVLSVPSNVLYVRRGLRDLVTNNTAYIEASMPPLYLRHDQYRALRYLDENASRSDVLLCNSFLGSYAPSLAGTTVYVGHWSETLDYAGKMRQLSTFLRAGTPDREREAFSRGNGIAYVLRDHTIYDDIFVPVSERGEAGYDADASEWLLPVFQQDRVALYRVTGFPP